MRELAYFILEHSVTCLYLNQNKTLLLYESHNKIRDLHSNTKLGNLPVNTVHDLLFVPPPPHAVPEPDLLVPGWGQAHTVVVGHEHLLVLFNVLDGHHGHDPAEPGVLKLLEYRVFVFKAVTSLVSESCSVI